MNGTNVLWKQKLTFYVAWWWSLLFKQLSFFLLLSHTWDSVKTWERGGYAINSFHHFFREILCSINSWGQQRRKIQKNSLTDKSSPYYLSAQHQLLKTAKEQNSKIFIWRKNHLNIIFRRQYIVNIYLCEQICDIFVQFTDCTNWIFHHQ